MFTWIFSYLHSFIYNLLILQGMWLGYKAFFHAFSLMKSRYPQVLDCLKFSLTNLEGKIGHNEIISEFIQGGANVDSMLKEITNSVKFK